MKKFHEIKNEILAFASEDERIRVVFLEGSRANPNILEDDFQDYDIVLAVKDFEDFLKYSSFTEIFGPKLIEQQPETFSFSDRTDNFFSYLILYKEGFRIDFSIVPVEKISDFRESMQILWLDKDNVFSDFPISSDSDFWVKKPGEKWFQEVCNEFWWVTTYVAKGLKRKEIPYAIKHLEEILRPMLMQILDWKIGMENDFSVSSGKSGKFYPKYLGEELYLKFLQTYSDAKPENIWKALFLMAEIFSENAKEVAAAMQLHYNLTEEKNVMNYLHQIKIK